MTHPAPIKPADALPVAPCPALPGAVQPQDPLAALARLRRPRLLIRAARFGIADYQRSRDLRRMLGRVPGPGPALLNELMDIEAAMDASRTAGDAAWRPAQHVDILVAVMAEARLMRCTGTDQENASGISALRLSTKSESASATAGSSGGA